MLNMNSPTVQNIVQGGFNPYMNNGYVPQQPVQQQIYYGYQQQPVQQYYGYNPYVAEPQQNTDNIQNIQLEYYYDPMPKVIVNHARGIHTEIPTAPTYNNSYNYYDAYNNQAFNGYVNPILMQNQMENERIRQREEAIQQGKIWRILLQKECNDDDFDIESAVQRVESLYYNEPYQPELSMKEKMVIDKNNRIAEIDAKAEYYKQNNIPMLTTLDQMRANFYGYYNHINSIVDAQNCGMMEYFTEVYPLLKQEELAYEAERYNRNLKNNYKAGEFNKLIDSNAKDKPDSYYYKLMETFADTGVKLETPNGLVITADEMEIKLPERLLQNNQDKYYNQRRKFFDAVFRKEG